MFAILPQASKLFSPANLRACQEDPGYAKLVNFWMESKYTLRYTGGLVPDVYQCFTKEMGVFANPTSQASPAKLRVAFEVAPFALLVEKAGGKTSDGVTGKSCLDIQITSVDQRTSACLGSADEVDRFNSMVLTGAPVAMFAATSDKPEGFGASHTSFYTSATAKDSYATLDEILDSKMADAGVRGIVKEVLFLPLPNPVAVTITGTAAVCLLLICVMT